MQNNWLLMKPLDQDPHGYNWAYINFHIHFAFNVSDSFNLDLCWLFQSDVEETLKRIQSHKGVVGIIIVNSEGKSKTMTSLPHYRPMECSSFR